MKRLACFLSFTLAWTLAHASDENSELTPLTKAEASAIITQQMEDKAVQKAIRKAELEAVPAIETRVIEKDGHRLTINRVAPPEVKVVSPVLDSAGLSNQLTTAELAALIAAQPERQSISLSVTVFGDEHSKVLWRQPRDKNAPREAPVEFELWTNINLNYLSPINTFDGDEVVYHYFGFTHTITHEGEAARKAFAQKWGHDYESRWQQPPVALTDGQPEYVVVESEGRPIPPELYQQMDALFAHYLANEAEFQAAYQRQQALTEARRAWHEANPPEPKDIVINFYPLSERGKGASQ